MKIAFALAAALLAAPLAQPAAAGPIAASLSTTDVAFSLSIGTPNRLARPHRVHRDHYARWPRHNRRPVTRRAPGPFATGGYYHDPFAYVRAYRQPSYGEREIQKRKRARAQPRRHPHDFDHLRQLQRGWSPMLR